MRSIDAPLLVPLLLLIASWASAPSLAAGLMLGKADEAVSINGQKFSMGNALRYLSKAIFTDALAGREL